MSPLQLYITSKPVSGRVFAVRIGVADPIAERGRQSTQGPVSAVKEHHAQPVKLNLRLAGAVGIPEGHASTPNSVSVQMPSKNTRDLRAPVGPFGHALTGSPTLSSGSSLSGVPSGTPVSEDGTKSAAESWPLRDALVSKRLVLVEDCMQLISGFPVRVWDDLPTSAVVVPISNDSEDGALGAVLVIGLSIRRPFDEDYESFVVSPFSSPFCAKLMKQHVYVILEGRVLGFLTDY
jgi:hypothetical protein